MRKSLLKTASGLAAVAALLIVPSTAPAATVVPPGNSAATQYTETLPTSGGNAEINGNAGDQGRTPAKTLGSETTKKLEARGPEGEAVAAFAAETTPSAQSASPSQSGGAGDEGAKHGSAAADKGGKRSTGTTSGRGEAAADSSGNSAVSVPPGSSGIGEVISHATGSTSGEMGILLPLILVGALIWALSQAWRQRSVSRGIH